MGAVEGDARDERARREPRELDLPADVAQRALAERTEGDRDHRPGERRPGAEEDGGGEREAGEEPAHARKAHQAERELVGRERGGAPAADALRDLPRVEPRRGRDGGTALRALLLGQPPDRPGEGEEADQDGERRRDEDERLPRLERAHRVGEGATRRDPVRLHRREREAPGVVDGHPGRYRSHDDTRPAAEGHQREPDEDHHQAGEHVQLGVEVDDHVARLAAAVEELVHRREGLHRPLEGSDDKGAAAGEDEGARRPGRAPHRAGDHGEQEPERSEHRDPRAHDQERVQRRRLFGLLGREAAPDDEPSLVEAEVERAPVERERAGEERPEARVRHAP